MFRNLIVSLLAALALNAVAFDATAAVDVNRATQAELETVKGIGPGLSGKILEARKAGEFKSWADMVDRVGGVGAGNAARFSQHGLTVGGAAYDGSAAAAPKAAKKTEKTEKAEKTSAADKAKP